MNDLLALLKNIYIVGVQDPVTQTVAPLHWISTDKSGKSVVIEQTKTGLEVIDNPIGVMANSPDFNWHITNLRNYMNVSTNQQKEVHWENVSLTPFGQGAGTTHLPGGFTSPERFVRTAFLKTDVQIPKSRSQSLMTCFHIINNIFIPKGIVVTDKRADDYTKYIAFMNTNTCEYYFKTYENTQILRASLWNYNIHSAQPIFLGNIHQKFY